MRGSTVGKLGVRDAFLPILQVGLDQHAKEGGEASIHHFSLAIDLWVVGGEEEELDS